LTPALPAAFLSGTKIHSGRHAVKTLVLGLLVSVLAVPALAAEPADRTAQVTRTRGTQFGFLAVNVADLAKSLAFYEGMLGLTEQFHNETATQVEVGLDFPGNPVGPHLLLVSTKGHQGAYTAGGTFNRFSLYVTGIEALCRRITAAGGEVTRPPVDNKAFKVKVAFAKDPDGNSVELLENYD
jgi:lactoylglutathione lyase